MSPRSGAETRAPRAGELVSAGSAVALLGVMACSWYGLRFKGSRALVDRLNRAIGRAGLDVTRTAWQAFTVVDVLLALAVLVTLGAVVAAVRGHAGRLPVTPAAPIAVAGGVAVALIALRITHPPRFSAGLLTPAMTVVTREYGLYLGLLAAAGMLGGGVGSLVADAIASLRRRPRSDRARSG